MEREIHIWKLKGLVWLNDEFTKFYEKKVKEYGIGRLSNELSVNYQTIAIYRRNKPISIRLLQMACNNLGIDESYAEKSIVMFTQNLKTKYEVKFPIKVTPFHLRAVSMIIGDGTAGPTFYSWFQHNKNIDYGSKFLKKAINYKPLIRVTSGSKNCSVISIPKFLADTILNELNCGSFKSKRFFEKVCELPRDWQFQVFAQLVVDEGSPDQDFKITQINKNITEGISLLLTSLSYQHTKTNRGVYINTESFPKIEDDFKNAKQKYGEFGGFWFKDERFEKACKFIDPKFSENLRVADEKFEKSLDMIREKNLIFTYKDIMKATDLSLTPVFARLGIAVKKGTVVRLNRDIYTFPENLQKIDAEWLRKTKEEKVLYAIQKLEDATYRDISKFTKLSEGQMWRAITNLLKNENIIRTDENRYRINKVVD
ncbi:MAG: hypothetical protein HZB67_05430 [Candidatus Aenigmarchaeota archaeon]|nr:hypothetical protein [Candidatus Aenigmarchaeota archaeon]